MRAGSWSDFWKWLWADEKDQSVYSDLLFADMWMNESTDLLYGMQWAWSISMIFEWTRNGTEMHWTDARVVIKINVASLFGVVFMYDVCMYGFVLGLVSGTGLHEGSCGRVGRQCEISRFDDSMIQSQGNWRFVRVWDIPMIEGVQWCDVRRRVVLWENVCNARCWKFHFYDQSSTCMICEAVFWGLRSITSNLMPPGVPNSVGCFAQQLCHDNVACRCVP